MSSLSPRSYANNRDLAAKSAQASSAHQGYLMMDNIAFGSRSSCAAQAWPDQARGAASSHGSARRKPERQSSFAATYYRSPQIVAFPQSIACAPDSRLHRILARDPAHNQYPYATPHPRGI